MKYQTPLAIVGALLVGVGGMWGYQQWQTQQRELAEAKATIAAAKAVPAEVELPPPPPPPTKPVAEEALAAGKGFTYEYLPPDNEDLAPVHEMVKSADLLRRIPEIQAVDGVFDFPRSLSFRTAECGQANAFYDPEEGTLTLCYEMIAQWWSFAAANVKAAPDKLPPDFPAAFTFANTRFAVLHEFGHALINELKLASTGREEDAADQLAVTLMLMNSRDRRSAADLSQNLQLAAASFMATAGEHDLAALSNEHSLNEQRYFNIQCLLYGSDPARYLPLVTRGKLPEDRAMRCQQESSKTVQAWQALLTPHLAPRYRKSEATPDAPSSEPASDKAPTGLIPRRNEASATTSSSTGNSAGNRTGTNAADAAAAAAAAADAATRN